MSAHRHRFPVSPLVAGFVTVLIGVASSAAIVFQAARAAGADAAMLASWMWSLGLGMGLTCIGLSLRYRTPVVTAWSTPGAALLVLSLSGLGMGEAVGAFMFSGALILVAGATGGFERLIGRIPLPIAGAMLAGILVRFGMDVFTAMQSDFVLVALMLAAYLACKRWLPRYAVVAVLVAGLLFSWGAGLMQGERLTLELARPVFTMPVFTWSACLGVGVPLFIVTMASQNLPGVAVMRASGYQTPISPLIAWTGVVTVLLAPFGCFAINLAAITAAICQGEEAHPDPKKRYFASVAAGGFYLALGIFGATVAALFTVIPKAFISAIAGIALFGTIANGLAVAMKNEHAREPAIVTFLVTASGVSAWGIGSAFWGVVAGSLTWMALRWPARRRAA